MRYELSDFEWKCAPPLGNYNLDSARPRIGDQFDQLRFIISGSFCHARKTPSDDQCAQKTLGLLDQHRIRSPDNLRHWYCAIMGPDGKVMTFDTLSPPPPDQQK
jgi:hypothetical protein